MKCTYHICSCSTFSCTLGEVGLGSHVEKLVSLHTVVTIAFMRNNIPTDTKKAF